MDLEQLRNEIDHIDREMLQLFERRMAAAEQIAQQKKGQSLPIYRPEREEAVLTSRTALLADQALAPFAQSYLQALMSVSRAWQTRCSLTKHLVLIGVMGCGKSAKGALLSQRLGLPFTDLDEKIEREQGCSIPALFQSVGESGFRQIEKAAVRAAVSCPIQVLSTGGGVILDEENMALLKRHGIIIFINRDIQQIAATIDPSNRPVLKGDPQNVINVYRQRLPLYQQWCDLEVTAPTIEGAVDEILIQLQSMPL